MMDKFKVVLGTVLISIIALGLVFAIPWFFPSEPTEETYPWFALGTENVTDLLWDQSMGMFRESQKENQSYWIDDNAKLLNLMLEDPGSYQMRINDVLKKLNSVYHEGYLPRRFVICRPNVENPDPKDVSVSNGFLRIMGNLSNPYDTAHPLRIRYYEASGYVDFGYLGGQSFTVDPADHYYDAYSVNPTTEEYDQINNPGFDANATDPTSEIKVETDLMPWEYDTPKYWYSGSTPPNYCVYSTRWAFEKSGITYNSWKRCIGFEKWATLGSDYDWRCDKFNVLGNTSYYITFYLRGTFVSGSPIRAYVRWFDSSDVFISENCYNFSSSFSVWTLFGDAFSSPINAAKCDIRIVCYADTIARYYFDHMSFGKIATEDQLIPNNDFEKANSNVQWVTATYHSPYRSLKLYNIEYAIQHLHYPINVSNLIKIRWFGKVASSTDYKVKVWYTDGNITTITFSDANLTWAEHTIWPGSLTAGKTIEAIGFLANGHSIDVWIDDVGISYSDPSSNHFAEVRIVPEGQYGEMTSVLLVQNFTDSKLEFENQYIFRTNCSFINQTMIFYNKDSINIDVCFHAAFDGLSGIITGNVYNGEDHTASYSSVWIPGVGRKFASSGIECLFSKNDNDYNKWSSDYFILELKQIPEWSGCLGLVAKIPKTYFQDVSNTQNPSYPGKLHYVTYSLSIPVESSKTGNMTSGIVCLNGYDFIHPGIYDHYINYNMLKNLDVSLNYHLGMICYSLSKYWSIYHTDAYGMAKGIFDYYKSIFTGHNNGSYLMTTGNMISASLILERNTESTLYIDFAKTLTNYLVTIQVNNASDYRDGTFPMKHNGISYLDCHAACLIGLKEMRSYNTSYLTAYNKGVNAIHYNFKPVGFHRIPTGGVGDDLPIRKRLWIYSNSTHIDDDFWIYKAQYCGRAGLGLNHTLTMLGLSRMWYCTAWTQNSLWIYNSESIPGRLISGIDPEVNSETQPWGLVAWKDIANWQLKNWQLYYEFLVNHYAITKCLFNEYNITSEVYAPILSPTISTIYYKGQDKDLSVLNVYVDGIAINESRSLTELYSSPTDCYYDMSENFTLIIKAFPKTSALKTMFSAIFSAMEKQTPMPIMLILGVCGVLMVVFGPAFAIYKGRKGKVIDGALYAFIIIIIGVGLIIAWLWG
jgi:hypothetical protein